MLHLWPRERHAPLLHSWPTVSSVVPTIVSCAKVVEVNCLLYDDITVIKALTLQAAAASLHHPSRQALPSARYLRLLQEGKYVWLVQQPVVVVAVLVSTASAAQL